MMRLDPAQLDALAAAVAEGTFDAAARTLHVTPSAISQRIKALESSTGRVLLIRSRPIRPTEAGQALLRLARQLQLMTSDALDEIGADDAGTLPVVRLAVNADSLDTWFVAALSALDPPDPVVVFDIRRDDQERTTDLLRRGEVMAAVTSSAQAVAGCSVERLGVMRYRPTATRAFAARWFADGVTPHTLERAPVVIFDREDQLQDAYLRRRARRALHPPRHYVPGSKAFVDAVRHGLGWGMLPDLQTEPLADDDLVVLDAKGAVDVALYWQQWRLRSPSLDRVGAAVRAAAAAIH